MKTDKEENPREKTRFWLSVILSTIVSVLGLAYLASIPFGWLGTNRFGTTEAIIFAAILFFNSVLIGKLERLSISTRGIEFEVARVREKQERQQNEIDSLRFLISNFVNSRELAHLRKLASLRVEDRSFHEEGKAYFHTELRHLRDLGFISHKGAIEHVPKSGNDLKVYCQITESGKQYLQLRQELESAPESSNESANQDVETQT